MRLTFFHCRILTNIQMRVNYHIIRISWHVLTISFWSFHAISQTNPGSTGIEKINYCQLVEAGKYYGQLSLASNQSLTEDQIKYFNGLIELSYLDPAYRLKLDADEFNKVGVYHISTTASFPPSTNYHRTHTDAFTVFHVAKEIWRLQHYEPGCQECRDSSMTNINNLLQGKRLWEDYNKQWRGAPALQNPLVYSNILDFDTFLRCYFIPDYITPLTERLNFPAPRVICVKDSTKVECKSDIKPDQPLLIPNCDMGAQVKQLPMYLVSGDDNCPGAIYAIPFVATSPCGSDTCFQYFEIENEPPTIICPQDQIVECAAEIVAENAQTTSSCNLSGNVQTDQAELKSGQHNCPGATYELRYMAIDKCGREADCIQVFTIENDPPRILCRPDSTVECMQDIYPGSAKVTTSCKLSYSMDISSPTLISGRENCPGAIYEVVYTVTDECGRTASCNRRFKIDNPPPVVDCPQDEIVECFDNITLDKPKVITSCGQKYTVTHTGPTLIEGDHDCPGAKYRVEYIVIEECGRTVKCDQIFTIDNDGPTAQCWEDEVVPCKLAIQSMPPVVETACDMDYDQVQSDPTNLGGIDDCPGTIYAVTYTITDDCGRTVECSQHFVIANDDPEITCPPDREVVSSADITPETPTVEVACNLGYTVDPKMPPELVSGDPDCPGAVYELTYVVKDTCGREASCVQRFTIMDQQITIDCPPDVVIQCEEEIQLHNTTSWLFGPVTLGNTKGPDLVNGRNNCPGAIYEVIYYLDPACDSTITCIQQFIIENEPPEITCPPDVVVSDLNETFDQNYSVKVSCGLDYYPKVGQMELTSGVQGEPGSTYRIKYSVEDDCGREAECYQNITLIGLDDTPTNQNPCDCDDQWWHASQDLTESRSDRFQQDIAAFLRKKSCQQIQNLVESGVTSFYREWASREILGEGFGYASDIAQRGNIAIALSKIGDIKSGIRIIEAALYGSEAEMRGILTTEFLTRAATYLSGSATPARVLTAVQDLGKFAAYLNQEILISNLKTFADMASRDPNFFDADHFLRTYAGLEELKPPNTARYNKIRVALYDYAQHRMNGYALPPAQDIWKSQANLNAIRVVARTMLNEVCDYYCYKKKLKNQLDRLKVEQSYLERFQKVWEYFKDTDCSGGLNQPPACNMSNATLVETSPGNFECQCDPGYKLTPDRTQCVTYDDCSLISNTTEVFQNGKYQCDCIEPGYQWNSSRTACVLTPFCDQAGNEEAVWDSNLGRYTCQCKSGFKKDPSGNQCIPFEDCGLVANSVEAFNGTSYICECAPGFKKSPDGRSCVPFTDCSNRPNSVETFDGTMYTCECITGYKLDPSGTLCVAFTDCSRIANTQEVYNGSYYECDCIAGYSWNTNRTACLSQTDCSSYPNATAVWNQSIQDYECDCIAGYEWNTSYTGCIEKAPDCQSFYPNSVAVWNPSVNGYECDCMAGYEWNASATACIQSRPDCQSFYPNTIAVWNAATNDYECDCLSGYEWNSSNTGCQEMVRQPDCSSIPNSQLFYDRFDNVYYCECIQGYKWNRGKTACVKRADPSQTIDAISGIIDALTGSGIGGINNNNPTVKPENQHTGQCNVTYGSGANDPEQYTINVHQTFGSLTFSYQNFTAKDRIQVHYGGSIIFDTGCTGGSQSTTFNLNGFSSTFRVVVNPLCDPSESHTQWNFTLGCPN